MTDLVWHLYDGFDPEERPEQPAAVEERDKEEVEDVAGNSSRPKCTRCGDPNFSLEKDVCIGCRALLSPSPRADIY